MSYVECPQCGQKALAVATRCPGCGRPLETGHVPPPVPASGLRRLPVVVVLAAVILGLVVVNALRGGFRLPPPSRAATGLDSPPARPVALESAAAHAVPADTVKETPARQSTTVPPRAATVVVVPPTPRPQPAASPPSSPAPTPGPAQEARARYANTWVNVHTDPSGHSPVLQILRPGDKVAVQSQERGWYRVVPDTGSPGYVDAHYLDTSPAAGRP